MGEKLDRTRFERTTLALGRLIGNAFGGREAKLSIPARPEHDDDLVLGQWLQDAQAEIERLRGRLRTTAQILIAEVGAEGPMNAEEAAEKAVFEIRRLQAKLQGSPRGISTDAPPLDPELYFTEPIPFVELFPSAKELEYAKILKRVQSTPPGGLIESPEETNSGGE